MNGQPDVLYKCCDHCAINPRTGACWDLDDHGGHLIPCAECDKGKEER